jgi:hypothetical protein
MAKGYFQRREYAFWGFSDLEASTVRARNHEQSGVVRDLDFDVHRKMRDFPRSQGVPLFDIDMAKKGHFWMEPN